MAAAGSKTTWPLSATVESQLNQEAPAIGDGSINRKLPLHNNQKTEADSSQVADQNFIVTATICESKAMPSGLPPL